MVTELPVGRLHISLSLTGDSANPDTPADSFGSIHVGPAGLLGIIETQLGIAPEETSFTARLIEYLACVDASNHSGAFYHASYEADPFSVARTLLQWRDLLYMGGWNGGFAPPTPARLADMAVIEQHAITAVTPGTGQRIQRAIGLLENHPTAIESITLLDTLEDFAPLWRTLLKSLTTQLVTPQQISPAGEGPGDLFTLQEHLLSGSTTPVQLAGDNSVLALFADSPHDSGPIMVQFLQQWQSGQEDLACAVLAEKRGEIFDDMLESAGSARLGFQAFSPWRPIFQVLPLSLELLWKPLSPSALFQFLSHPVGPIPGKVREQLARTVSDMPGIGSDRWQQTVTKCLDEAQPHKRSKLEESIAFWTNPPGFDPDIGVDCDTLIARAKKVADWLHAAKETSADNATRNLYNIALNQALEYVITVQRLRTHGRQMLSRDNVRRLIEDVRGRGAPVTDRFAEVSQGVAAVLRADHAGAFHSPQDNVIWWDCQATDRIQRSPWTKKEYAYLHDHGMHLPTEDEQLAWLGKAWMRPILLAKKRIILVIHSDCERHHPIWDQIQGLVSKLPVHQLSEDSCLDDLGIRTETMTTEALPKPTRWWQLPDGIVIPPRESESFSSLDGYIHSPYQWLLRYAARVRPGSLANLTDGNQLKGTLAHRLYEDYFNCHAAINSIDTKGLPDWVDKHSYPLLEEEGAPLLEPGRQAECEQFIAVVKNSLTTLVEHLQSAAVVRVAMELSQEGQYIGGKLMGSIDLLAFTADDKEAVIDIKWGGKNYRRDAMRNNSYLQLATYAALRLGNGATSPPALSYFIVSDSHMLNLAHDFFPDGDTVTPDTSEDAQQYWRRFEHSWTWRQAQFSRGRIEITVAGTEADQDSDVPAQGLEIPNNSDTFNDYAALTGWEPNA